MVFGLASLLRFLSLSSLDCLPFSLFCESFFFSLHFSEETFSLKKSHVLEEAS